MFFGMPFALFPALAQAYGGEAVVGLLYAAPPAGAVVATLTSGWTRRVHRHGRAVGLRRIGWGVAIAAFGFASTLWVALLCLALAGAADAVSGVFRATIWNETIPDRLRGRLAGVEMISWSSGPMLGNADAGTTESLPGCAARWSAAGSSAWRARRRSPPPSPRLWAYDSRVVAAGQAPGGLKDERRH